ncbi:uncharacterized protein HaLaN_10155, partial [Haematococcus lacustris]
WDPALLQSCAHHKEAVSSLQGLQEDKEFQAYIRSKHGNLDLHMEQVEARLHTYRHLRTIDRGGFLFALSRNDVKEFIHRPAPRHLLVLEQVLTSVAVYACFLAILLNIPGGCGCLLGLLTAQTLFAWAASHPSLLARGLSLYTVRACPGRLLAHQHGCLGGHPVPVRHSRHLSVGVLGVVLSATPPADMWPAAARHSL